MRHSSISYACRLCCIQLHTRTAKAARQFTRYNVTVSRMAKDDCASF